MTAAVVPVFERSLEQRRAALIRANDVRVARARMKKAIAAGGIDAVATMRCPPDFAMTMRVEQFLATIPKIGRVKARRLMRLARIAESKTLGGMSDRQRTELTHLVETHGWRG